MILLIGPKDLDVLNNTTVNESDMLSALILTGFIGLIWLGYRFFKSNEVLSSKNEASDEAEVTGAMDDIFGNDACSSKDKKETWQLKIGNFLQIKKTKTNLQNFDILREYLDAFDCLNQSIQRDPLDKKSCELQLEILKRLHKLLKHSRSLQISNPETFEQWMAFIICIASRDVPEVGEQEICSGDLVWRQCKQWSIRILIRTFEICCLDEQKARVFAELCLDAAILCFTNDNNTTQEAAKIIVKKVIFCAMQYSEEDYQLCQNDTRSHVKIWESYSIIRESSQDLLIDICKANQGMLKKTMGFVLYVLNKSSAISLKNIDGVLLMIGSISDLLMEDPTLKEELEPMLVAHVFALFDHQHAPLRLRAFWILNAFTMLKFKDQTNVRLATKYLLAQIFADEKDLLVRAEAFECLTGYLKYQVKAREVIEQVVHSLAFKLVEINRITKLRQPLILLVEIFKRYNTHQMLIAKSADIASNLSSTLIQLLEAELKLPEDKNDEIQASKMIIDTIGSILLNVRYDQKVKGRMVSIIENIAHVIFGRCKCELYEKITNLLSMMNCISVSSGHLRVFEALCYALKNDSSKFTSLMNNLIILYMEHYPQIEKTALLDACQSIFTATDLEVESAEQLKIEFHAARLVAAAITKPFGRVDTRLLPSFFHMAAAMLNRENCSIQVKYELTEAITMSCLSATITEQLQR